MPDKREKDLFIVSDKRKFTAEGELKDDFPTAAEIAAEKTAAVETKPEAAASEAPEEGKPRMVKSAEPTPEEAAAREREMPAPPTSEEQAEQHAVYKTAGKQVDDMLREHGAPPNAFREITFEQLVMSLYMQAMMQLGAVRPEGQQPAPPDIIGARQTIDTIGVLHEKTKGNLSEKESNILE